MSTCKKIYDCTLDLLCSYTQCWQFSSPCWLPISSCFDSCPKCGRTMQQCAYCLCCIVPCYPHSCLRECNCMIFPAPSSNNKILAKNNPQTQVKQFTFPNKHQQNVPYIQISNQKSRSNKKVLLYFHGNGQDIFSTIPDFLIPIFNSLQITILQMQYPTYSCYPSSCGIKISDRIKQDSIQFHKFIKSQYNLKDQNILIMGRSIGSGPAAYLASQVKCDKLILISPFDRIVKVAESHACFFGRWVKDHFNNIKAMDKYKGELCVVHGQRDQVIGFSLGRNLVQKYEEKTKQRADFIQPPCMTHNNFEIQEDIIKPIKRFFNSQIKVKRFSSDEIQ